MQFAADFDRLAVSECMRHAANAGYPFGQHCSARRFEAFEPFLHAAMLEEQLRMIMNDSFAEIEEHELGRLKYVGAHRAKRQQLHVVAGAGNFRDDLPAPFHQKRPVHRIVRRERRQGRRYAFMQH